MQPEQAIETDLLSKGADTQVLPKEEKLEFDRQGQAAAPDVDGKVPDVDTKMASSDSANQEEVSTK